MTKMNNAVTWMEAAVTMLWTWTSQISKLGVERMEATVLRKSHAADPVDSLEIIRNDVIYTEFQHNRNPFIDYPEWVYQINDFLI